MKRSLFERADHRDLKEHEAGVSDADLCRKHGVSDTSIYKWKASFGDMEVSEAKRLDAISPRCTTCHSARKRPPRVSLIVIGDRNRQKSGVV